MRKTTSVKLIALIALLSFATPAMARHDDHHYRGNRSVSKHYKKQVKRSYKRKRRAVRQAAKWDWNRHNWNEQRNYLHSNWASRSARINAAQRAQLDQQLRAQWLSYHNNNWNGGYDWNQYNDPTFWDYVHTNNPSLLNTIRGIFNF
jgi:hypothetical protein